jgi:hypothetical protein
VAALPYPACKKLNNALLLAGHPFLPRIARFRTVANLFHPNRGNTAAAALNAFPLNDPA